MDICCIKDCRKPVHASGMCGMHLARMRRHGNPMSGARKQAHGLTLQERFDTYTVKSDGCWLWSGYCDPQGYGRLNISNIPVLAHRISYALHCREITSEEHVLHKCDNPACVNPEHLFLGDTQINMADKMAKKRHRYGVSRGDKHGMSKLTPEQVLEIRQLKGSSIKIGAEYGVSGRQVRDIRNLKVWRHI